MASCSVGVVSVCENELRLMRHLGVDAEQEPAAFGQPDPAFGDREAAVVILVQSTGPVVPGVRGLDDPALGQHPEASAGGACERRWSSEPTQVKKLRFPAVPNHMHDDAVLVASLSRAPPFPASKWTAPTPGTLTLASSTMPSAALGSGSRRSCERDKARSSSGNCSNKPSANHLRKVRYTRIHSASRSATSARSDQGAACTRGRRASGGAGRSVVAPSSLTD